MKWWKHSTVLGAESDRWKSTFMVANFLLCFCCEDLRALGFLTNTAGQVPQEAHQHALKDVNPYHGENNNAVDGWEEKYTEMLACVIMMQE